MTKQIEYREECFENEPFALLLHGLQEKNTPSAIALKEIRKNKKLVEVR